MPPRNGGDLEIVSLLHYLEPEFRTAYTDMQVLENLRQFHVDRVTSLRAYNAVMTRSLRTQLAHVINASQEWLEEHGFPPA